LILNKIKQFGLFLLVAVILGGSTGFTFFTHSCSSSMMTETSLYPELFGRQYECCCNDAIQNNPGGSASPTTIHLPDCCNTHYYYIKAAFCGFPVVYKITNLLSGFLFFHEPASINIIALRYEPESGLYLADPSPPFSGKKLVQFLNQIKIPFPVG